MRNYKKSNRRLRVDISSFKCEDTGEVAHVASNPFNLEKHLKCFSCYEIIADNYWYSEEHDMLRCKYCFQRIDTKTQSTYIEAIPHVC